MPRIPINQFDQEWEDQDLEHDHLGRPLEPRRPRKPKDPEEIKSSKRDPEPLHKNND